MMEAVCKIVDVTDSFWDMVNTVNACAMDEVTESEIFEVFQQHVDEKAIFLVRYPREKTVHDFELCQIACSIHYLHTRQAFLFEDVDSLFNGMQRLLEEGIIVLGGDTIIAPCALKEQLDRCLARIQVKLDIDLMDSEFDQLLGV